MATDSVGDTQPEEFRKAWEACSKSVEFQFNIANLERKLQLDASEQRSFLELVNLTRCATSGKTK